MGLGWDGIGLGQDGQGMKGSSFLLIRRERAHPSIWVGERMGWDMMG